MRGYLDLYCAGKAPRLIFTGGWLPWFPNSFPEDQQLQAIALVHCIPPGAITVTTLLPPNPTLLLVTS